MAKFPYLPLWTDAYIADTQHLTAAEHGAYLLLLMSAWRAPECDLPSDPKRLALIARMTPDEWLECAPAVLPFFDEHDGRLTQKRLLKEHRFIEQKRKAGSKGGKRKASKAASRKPSTQAGENVGIPHPHPHPHPHPSPESEPEPDSHPEPENESCAEPASPPAAPQPVVISLPLAGKDNPEVQITADQVGEWAEAYPGLDVEQQLRNMRQWLVHNPSRRKTAGGVGRFITGWLAKEQNRGPGRTGAGESSIDQVERLRAEGKI